MIDGKNSLYLQPKVHNYSPQNSPKINFTGLNVHHEIDRVSFNGKNKNSENNGLLICLLPDSLKQLLSDWHLIDPIIKSRTKTEDLSDSNDASRPILENVINQLYEKIVTNEETIPTKTVEEYYQGPAPTATFFGESTDFLVGSEIKRLITMMELCKSTNFLAELVGPGYLEDKKQYIIDKSLARVLTTKVKLDDNTFVLLGIDRNKEGDQIKHLIQIYPEAYIKVVDKKGKVKTTNEMYFAEKYTNNNPTDQKLIELANKICPGELLSNFETIEKWV